jgi:crossover junction endodeoxyribonuclease RuvC
MSACIIGIDPDNEGALALLSGNLGLLDIGGARGCLEGIFGAMGVSVTMLTVPTWRRALGLPVAATKEMARGAAVRRWPAHAVQFARVRDDGRAEAVLIAVAGLFREATR